MSTSAPDPRISEVYAARQAAQKKIAASVHETLEEFNKATGLHISAVDLTIVEHYTDRVMDGALLTDVTVVVCCP